MYAPAQLIEGKDVSFQPRLEKESIIVKGMTESEWEIFSSDMDMYWDMKHPFACGETFKSLDEYNSYLKDFCERNSHKLATYIYMQ